MKEKLKQTEEILKKYGQEHLLDAYNDIKDEKEKEEFQSIISLNKKKNDRKALLNSVRIRGMSLALFFKKIDDISVIISIKNQGECSFDDNLGKNNKSAFKD